MIPALFALLLIAEEPQQAVGSDVQAEAEVQKPAKERKICRTEDSGTGSRMKKKMCLTQTEWDRRAAGRNAADLNTLSSH
jgi:hypothetical protein